jgi:poly-gamma-glutamate synthesis protein (capsule biosynthesis protein)
VPAAVLAAALVAAGCGDMQATGRAAARAGGSPPPSASPGGPAGGASTGGSGGRARSLSAGVRSSTPTASPTPDGPTASTTPRRTGDPDPPASTAGGGARHPSGAAVTLAFAGDVHFEGASRARLDADPATAVGPMSADLRKADVAVVNLETAVTTRGEAASKAFVFRAPPAALDALRAAGVDVANVANNHGMDYGLTGLRDTLAAGRSAKFPLVGIGEDDAAAYAPYRTTVRGQRIAVIGATQVIDEELVSAWSAGPHHPGLASAKKVERLLTAVRSARKDSDTLVVFLHWGLELASCPTAAQQELARALTAAGADIVVGSHAHVLLAGGRLGDAYVDYGLGNFVFYAGGGGPNTESGVLTLTVRGRAVTAERWAPARISGGAPRPATGAAGRALADRWRALRSCAGLKAVA